MAMFVQVSRIALLLVFVAESRCTHSDNIPKLRTISSWKSLEFAFPSKHDRDLAISRKEFIPGAPIPIDVDVYYSRDSQRSTVFISIPRFQDGVPATLGIVTDQVTPEGNPIIAPYPSWELNRLGNCNAITSVYRMKVDEDCDRLWVLDTGKTGDTQVCPPQLHVFSLKTNQLISQYKFPKDQYVDESLFVTPIVDVRDGPNKCLDTFVYIADVGGFALLVYDHRNARSWKIVNNLFYPYPPHGTFNIKGDSFDLMDGILGLALSSVKPDGDRILYFHPLSSNVESWVPTSIIRNNSIFAQDRNAAPRAFKVFPMERSSQSAAQAMDRNDVLFFGLMSDLAIGCWNSKNYPEYGGNNIEKIVVNPETLQFASGVKVVMSNSGHQELWILTSSFQKYMAGTLNPQEINFRIQAGYIEELVRGTKCHASSANATGRRYMPGNSNSGK